MKNKTPSEMLDETIDAIEEAMGIRTHVDMSNPSDPKMIVSQRPKDNAKLLRLYKTPSGKLSVDKFCKLSGNPIIRKLIGISHEA
jgi:hypothetical protein